MNNISLSTTTLLLPKYVLPNINLAHAPDLPLVFPLVLAQPNRARDATLCIPPLASLRAEAQRDPLEIIAHAPLHIGRQVLATAAAATVVQELVKHLGFFVNDVEECDKGRLGGELDRDDHVPHRGEHGRGEEPEVWADEVHVGAGDGADHHEGKAAGVEGAARGDDGGEFFKNGFGGFEGFGGVG